MCIGTYVCIMFNLIRICEKSYCVKVFLIYMEFEFWKDIKVEDFIFFLEFYVGFEKYRLLLMILVLILEYCFDEII